MPHYKDSGDVPEGLTQKQWDGIYNAADSYMYNFLKKNKTKNREARETGLTRTKALEMLAKRRAEAANQSAAASSFTSADFASKSTKVHCQF